MIQQGAGSITDLGGHALLVGAGAEFKLLGGRLKGGGMIDGNLNNTSGIVEVGDNPASLTLSVTGAYNQGAGALLQVDAAGVQGSGKLSVQGTADLAGTVAFVGDIGLGNTIVFLEAAGINGAFPPVGGWQLNFTQTQASATRV